MKGSFFVRRQLMQVVMTISVTVALIWMVFNVIASSVFMQQKADEFENNATFLGRLYLQYEMDAIGDGPYEMLVTNSISTWDARIAIFNREGIASTYSQDFENLPPEEQSVVKLVRPYVDTVLKGTGVKLRGVGGLWRSGDIIVGVPIMDEKGNVLAAVFMTRRIAELNTALDSFNMSLVLSIFGVLVVMLMPTYIGAKLLARPIYQMRDVALRMARGDFSAHANEHIRGEFGELGSTLNYLSKRLFLTISELRLEKTRLASIVDGLGEGILAVDANGEITHFNPALLTMFKPKAISVGSWERMNLIPDQNLWDDFTMTIRERTPMIRNFTWDGAELMVTISPLENEIGEPEGAVGLFRDVTEQARLEQTRKDYVANVSHELRTPVSSIRGLTEALKDGLIKTDEDRQRYYGFILRETMRLTRLIEDLLELSRLQSGTVALSRERVDIKELLLEFAEHYAHGASDINIDFSLDIQDDCPAALTNSDRVEQVLVVLVDNAIKFTPSGGSITVGAARDGDFLRLSVADTGCGIEPEDLAHVFDRFYKADKAHTGSGTGLGLSIANEIVQLLGGKMTVQSESGKGSVFSFTVPVG